MASCFWCCCNLHFRVEASAFCLQCFQCCECDKYQTTIWLQQLCVQNTSLHRFCCRDAVTCFGVSSLREVGLIFLFLSWLDRDCFNILGMCMQSCTTQGVLEVFPQIRRPDCYLAACLENIATISRESDPWSLICLYNHLWRQVTVSW